MTDVVRLSQVPPPSNARIDPMANEMGLLDGIYVSERDAWRSPFRCSCCRRMISGDTVWVPESVSVGDDPDVITDCCRASIYNGSWSGWCAPCAKSLNGSKAKASLFGRSSMVMRVIAAIKGASE